MHQPRMQQRTLRREATAPSPTMVSVEGVAPGLGYTQTMPWYSAQGRAVAQVRPDTVLPAATCGMFTQLPLSPSNVQPACTHPHHLQTPEELHPGFYLEEQIDSIFCRRCGWEPQRHAVTSEGRRAHRGRRIAGCRRPSCGPLTAQPPCADTCPALPPAPALHSAHASPPLRAKCTSD